ncbi:MAG: UDP-N-acetylmuramate dehydrogenase [candidate division Zixibacteria bacterium]|nr:UDP-N-acetylmuramate dehydrogenase [candidate division Zixibacteria bacterium]
MMQLTEKALLAADLGFRIERDYPLAKLTTFGIGGPADWTAFCTKPEQVIAAVKLCSDYGLDYFVLGGGSNVLASDKGFRGMIILPRIESFRVEGTAVSVGAAFSLARMIEIVVEAGLGGLESLSGIAGTVGGAIVGNAGAYGQSISDTLIDVQLYHPDRGLYTEVKENLGFKYRHSNLKWSKNIVLSARFGLKQDDVEMLRDRAAEILEQRWSRHPHEDISAGCFFKNIEDKNAPHGKIAAGFLLEQIGAKQTTVGQAGVYPNHANILINKGGASASDVRKLSLLLKQKVKEAYGVELNEEVVLLGDFS